jgi:hypothetical protein
MYVSDIDYCDSEFGGDDNAEDDLPLKSLSSSSRSTSISSSPLSTVDAELSTSSNVTLRNSPKCYFSRVLNATKEKTGTST